MSNRMLAVIACIALALGVFSPIITIPILGAQNYFQNGKGDGTAILVLAVVGLCLIAARAYRMLFVAGGLSLLLCVYTFLTLISMLDGIRDKIHDQLKDNPFAGLADAAVGSIQIQWGWVPLVGGSVLLMVMAVRCFREESAVQALITTNNQSNLAVR